MIKNITHYGVFMSIRVSQSGMEGYTMIYVTGRGEQESVGNGTRNERGISTLAVMFYHFSSKRIKKGEGEPWSK